MLAQSTSFDAASATLPAQEGPPRRVLQDVANSAYKNFNESNVQQIGSHVDITLDVKDQGRKLPRHLDQVPKDKGSLKTETKLDGENERCSTDKSRIGPSHGIVNIGGTQNLPLADVYV